jgi:hypothetical protein
MKYLIGIGAVLGMCAAVAVLLGFLGLWFELWDWIGRKTGSNAITGIGFLSLVWVPILGIVFFGAIAAYEDRRSTVKTREK